MIPGMPVLRWIILVAAGAVQRLTASDLKRVASVVYSEADFDGDWRGGRIQGHVLRGSRARV